MCDLDVTGTPSTFKLIRSTTDFGRILTKSLISGDRRTPHEGSGKVHCLNAETVYHLSIERELNRGLIYECRCDERLKVKGERSKRLTCTGLCGELGQNT